MPFLVPPVVSKGAMRDPGQPTLQLGHSLHARPMVEADAAWIVEAFHDPDIERWHMRDLSREEAIAWIQESHDRWASETGGNWALIGADDVPVGRLGLHSVDLPEGTAEIGYWVLPHARRRGVATAAVSGLASWALEGLGLHRLEVCHSVDNEPSCRVAEASGFAYEGIKRSALQHMDGWHDMHLHGRIRPIARPGGTPS